MSKETSTAHNKFVKLEPQDSTPDATPLRATVKSGQNQFDFDVK